ncbi:hypothetical protein B0H14DRAFT_3132229 [Mycena olivaceomarginata]|nr:hypothetical protein B0H14DRAFT_3132229 [Mycena olivaceomarginata]
MGASSPGAAPTSSAGSTSCSRSSSCQCVLPGPLHHTRLRCTFAFSASTTQTRSRSTRPPAGDMSDVKIAMTFIKYVDYVTLFALMAASNTSHSGMCMLSLLITAEYSAWEWYSPSVLPRTTMTTTSDQRELIAPGCE